MNRYEIADILEQIGTLLELKGENPFKVRAYKNGARVLESMENADFEKHLEADDLIEVKGIGEALAKKVSELHKTGKLEFYEKLRASIPAGMIEMLEIPGLGPKKIKALHDKLGVDSVAALEAACQRGEIAGLEGFGEKTQDKLLSGIRNKSAYSRRHLWWSAYEVALPIVEGLRKLPGVARAEAAGSLRRGLETVGDLDFIVAAPEPGPVMEWFVSLPEVQEVTAKGDTKSSVRFRSGLQADLRLVPEHQFAFALHHFTGSKDHNIQMRQRALARGWSLSEWGLSAVEAPGKAEKIPAVESEEALFKALGLPFIAPELREGLGEIEAAEKGKLPRLLELSDLKGAFHNHTTESDGRATLAEMAEAAEALGWEYLGIADHSKSSFQAHGLDEERLLRQVEQIRQWNAKKGRKTVLLAGTECDILADGRLDFSDETLAQLDYVVASVHNAGTPDEEAMTKRIVRALENPHVSILGHMTGRLLLRREPYPVNVEKVIDAAIANGVAIELNANPMRLDLDWRHWRKAAEKGLLCAIDPDAHDTESLGFVLAGVNSARKGWLTKEQVLNTRGLAELKELL